MDASAPLAETSAALLAAKRSKEEASLRFSSDFDSLLSQQVGTLVSALWWQLIKVRAVFLRPDVFASDQRRSYVMICSVSSQCSTTRTQMRVAIAINLIARLCRGSRFTRRLISARANDIFIARRSVPSLQFLSYFPSG